jgi:hypothetical protein
MTRLIKYIIFSLLFTNMAAAQIDIPITPPVNPPRTPVDPPGPREPISVRPDPSRPGGGDFDGKYYEYCGPSWLGYKCNFLRSDGVAKMRDVSNAYKAKQVSSYQKEMDAATANVDRDLASLREGLVSPDSEEGKHIRAKLDAAKGLKANAATIDNATIQFQETATTDINSTVDVSFGLAYKESDKKDYEPEARKVNLAIGERFIKSKIKREQDRADAIESQIKNGLYADKDSRLAMVNSGRVALEISAQSLQQGDVAKSNFALKVGTVFLDTAISVTPVLGWAKDGWEAVTGRNLLTGEKLSGFERTMAVVGVLTAGIGSKLAIAGKAAVLVDVLRAGKAAEEAADVAKVASRAAEIAEAAAKAGVKEKSIIDEVAAAVKEGMPCSVAMNSVKFFLLKLFEDVAYAGGCLPGSAESAIKDALEESGEVIKNLTPKKVIAYLQNVENVPKPQLVEDMKSIGLQVKGSSPDGRFMEFIDSQTRVRAKIHPPDKVTSYDHLHIYDKSGNSLDKVLNIVSSKSPDAHIPISGG